MLLCINLLIMFKNRFKVNKKAIFRKTWDILTGMYTIWGFISMFVTIDLFCGKNSWISFLLSLLVFVVIFVIIFLYSAFTILRVKKECAFDAETGHKVWLHFGDIFSYINKEDKNKYNIVIPANCCFDTIVDDDLISHNSIHGKVFSYLYEKNIYTEETLNQTISKGISNNKAVLVETLNREQKRKGNLDRYDVGSIVEIKQDEFINYFMLALTKMDDKLSTSVTKEDFGLAIQRLIDYSKQRSQEYPIVLPLIGSGLSKLGLSKQKILNYLLSLLKMNENNLCCDFHIVILERDRGDITLYS